MKFEMGDEKGSVLCDSMDQNTPLAERFLSLMLFKFISGDESGVTADELGCTDEDIEEMMNSEDFDADDLDFFKGLKRRGTH